MVIADQLVTYSLLGHSFYWQGIAEPAISSSKDSWFSAVPLPSPEEVALAAQEFPQIDFRPKLLRRTEVAEGTLSFYFEKPPAFLFKAGQAADMTLLHPAETDSEGDTRALSIASAPFEDQLMFVTRLRDSAFKRSLKTMPLGAEAKLSAAMGSLTLHKNSAKPAVFLAGGIGITPFRSILCQADHDRTQHKLYLFYSNRRPEDAPFLDSLASLEKSNPNFRFVATMTDMSGSKRKWGGETGWINKEMLLRYLKDLAGPIYYIAGPPGMVAGMKTMLVASGADEDDIRTEEFAGY